MVSWALQLAETNRLQGASHVLVGSSLGKVAELEYFTFFFYKTKQKLTPYLSKMLLLPSSSSVTPQGKRPLLCSACSDVIPGLSFCQHSWDCAPRLHLFVDVGLHSLGTAPQAPSMDINTPAPQAHGMCPVPVSLITSILLAQAQWHPWCQPNSGKDVAAKIQHPHSLACASPR